MCLTAIVKKTFLPAGFYTSLSIKGISGKVKGAASRRELKCFKFEIVGLGKTRRNLCKICLIKVI